MHALWKALRSPWKKLKTAGVLLIAVAVPVAARQYSASAAKKTVPAAVDAADHRAAGRTDEKTGDVQAEYQVGEGDLLRINVWKESEISQSVAVRPDGNISLPLVNEVRVAGLTPRQIQDLITERLKTVLTNPQVTVTVTEVRSKMVYITGEVGRPGAYPVMAPTNVLQLIARAGGLTQFANRKDIYILRAGEASSHLRFNYKDVVKGKNSEQNITLRPGDTVVVP